MGSFANALFNGLFGWLQSAVRSLWDVFSKDPKQSFLAWVGDHWILLAVLLCAAGLLCDLGVYLLRWQPFRVWRSYWERRRSRKEEPEEETETGVQDPEPVFSRGDPEALPAEPAMETVPAIETVSSAGTYRTPAGYAVSEDSPYRRPAEPELTETAEDAPDTAEIERRIIRSGRRRRAARLMREFNENAGVDYPAVEDLIDSQEAYFRPVYPQNWQNRENEKNE
ncbi:MAG: hypothetical protein J6U01_12210 [Clostridia bacterium]|nr:hypothetical protein [Clostridia bacterium]